MAWVAGSKPGRLGWFIQRAGFAWPLGSVRGLVAIYGSWEVTIWKSIKHEFVDLHRAKRVAIYGSWEVTIWKSIKHEFVDLHRAKRVSIRASRNRSSNRFKSVEDACALALMSGRRQLQAREARAWFAWGACAIPKPLFGVPALDFLLALLLKSNESGSVLCFFSCSSV